MIEKKAIVASIGPGREIIDLSVDIANSGVSNKLFDVLP